MGKASTPVDERIKSFDKKTTMCQNSTTTERHPNIKTINTQNWNNVEKGEIREVRNSNTNQKHFQELTNMSKLIAFILCVNCKMKDYNGIESF